MKTTSTQFLSILIIFLITVQVSLTSCTDKQNGRKAPVSNIQETGNLKPALEPSAVRDFISGLKEIRLPAAIFIDYSSIPQESNLALEWKNGLQMSNLPGYHGGPLTVLGRITLTNGLTALLVCYYRGEMEMLGLLAIYDREFRLVDTLTVSYDEIAESMVQMRAIIRPGLITTSNRMGSDGEPAITVNHYRVSPEGKFIPDKNNH